LKIDEIPLLGFGRLNESCKTQKGSGSYG